MLIIKGNKTEKMDAERLKELVGGFKTIIMDLGTGDGRFVYKNALKNVDVFYIGIDPSEKQLKISAREIQRKKLDNILLVVGSAEQPPEELCGLADTIYVNFPWGTLLETFAKPVEQNLRNIFGLLKEDGNVQVIFGYDESLEPSETKRLNLPAIDIEYIKDVLIPKYGEFGLRIVKFGRFDTQAKKVETTWNKKLNTGRRDWFYIEIARYIQIINKE
jgi:16S rRNA (adenine(1408)-N(1))-methyltransferase